MRRDKADVTERLQRAGVPAAPMNRAVDMLSRSAGGVPKVAQRHGASAVRRADAQRDGPGALHRIPPAELRPAPMPGEQTREICEKVLGLTTDETDRLIADGVLFAHQRRP